MIGRDDLKNWVAESLSIAGGSATIVDVAKHIWTTREAELRASGDLFFTWQYDMRWAATRLRKEGKIVMSDDSPRGLWELTKP
jgi:hypothetical protein